MSELALSLALTHAHDNMERDTRSTQRTSKETSVSHALSLTECDDVLLVPTLDVSILRCWYVTMLLVAIVYNNFTWTTSETTQQTKQQHTNINYNLKVPAANGRGSCCNGRGI